jgi:hypothetical protein
MKTLLAAILLAAALFPGNTARAAPLAPIALSAPVNLVTVKDGSGVCRPQPEGPKLMRLFARKCQLGYRRNLLGKCVKE